MMLDWEQYRQQLFATIQEIGKTAPDVVRGYRMLGEGAAKVGKLDAFTAKGP